MSLFKVHVSDDMLEDARKRWQGKATTKDAYAQIAKASQVRMD